MTLQKIEVLPLAAESLGVRSLCTYIETPDLRLLLDPGVSLCPSRFRLPPHPLEFKAIQEARHQIATHAEKAEVVSISHYHFDHHTPSYEDWLSNWTNKETATQIYEDKLVLAKSYRADVNASQRRRGWIFKKTGGKHAKTIEFADDKSFSFNDTTVRFTHPVFHGLPDTPLGWVLMTIIEHDDTKVLFTSDVQGPMDTTTRKTIITEKPDLLIIGGPPTYLVNFRVAKKHIKRGLRNLAFLVRKIPMVVVDHHLLREKNWRTWMEKLIKPEKDEKWRLITAAELLGVENHLLEAKRDSLFEDDPPSKEFERWAKMPELKRKKTVPPL